MPVYAPTSFGWRDHLWRDFPLDAHLLLEQRLPGSKFLLLEHHGVDGLLEQIDRGNGRLGRLSPAAYETLAIVAYQQPVTRSQVEELRGVNSESVLANLELRNLVAEVGRGSGPGQPKLYGTTMRFLQLLGLENLDDLPKPGTAPLDRELEGSASSA